MKSLAANVRTKLAAIIPRLATNHDGERLATVAAIERTLSGAGHDLHDLAAFVGHEPARPRQDHKGNQRHDDAVVIWTDLTVLERCEWIDALLYGAPLTEWEFSFCESLRRQWLDRGRLTTTPKQDGILNKLLWKALGAGVRP